jgi:hypothetical protein
MGALGLNTLYSFSTIAIYMVLACLRQVHYHHPQACAKADSLGAIELRGFLDRFPGGPEWNLEGSS